MGSSHRKLVAMLSIQQILIHAARPHAPMQTQAEGFAAMLKAAAQNRHGSAIQQQAEGRLQEACAPLATSKIPRFPVNCVCHAALIMQCSSAPLVQNT